ncbi:MAG: polysaccharide pyruvyl transferase CsaB [Thermosynechococcaceae cyanobacterium]
MKQIQAVLCGYYGFGNGGDEALLASLLQMLPDHVTPLVLSGNPAETEQLHEVKSCDRNHPPTVFSALRSSQAFIWGGGSLIQDATSTLSPVYYTGLMFLAQRLGLQTIAWAQGIGPLNYRRNQWIAKQTFRGCAGISVRDLNSTKLIKSWKLQAVQAPDPVWALEGTSVYAQVELPNPRIAVSLREHPLLTPQRLGLLSEALVQFQAQTEASILLLPFQARQDLEIAQTLQAQLLGPSQILMLTDPRQLKGVFQTVDMAIAMRLHALIMAAAEGCRCVGLSYDPKVTQLMQDIGCPGWELDALPSESKSISKLWIEHYRQGQGLAVEDREQRCCQALKHQQVLQDVL